MRFALRVLLAVPGWLAYIVLSIPPIVAGLVLVPILAACNAVETVDSSAYPGRKVLAFKPRWAWLWGNLEDGVDGAANGFWPAQKPGSWAQRRQIIRWSAWRNSVGNARWTALYGVTVDPARVSVYPPLVDWAARPNVKEGPYIARQGWRFELKFCWTPKDPDWQKRRYCWIGWRLAQQTAVTPGTGFALQLWAAL